MVPNTEEVVKKITVERKDSKNVFSGLPCRDSDSVGL
jgi:hypothetical protein